MRRTVFGENHEAFRAMVREFLTREVAALRNALGETATRDFVRSELRGLLEELEERGLEVRQRDGADTGPGATGSAGGPPAT